MKSTIILATLLALVYLAQANNFKLLLLVGKNHSEKISGNLTVTLYGTKQSKKYTFDQTEFEYALQGIPGSIDFSEDDIQKVDVTWNTEEDFEVQINVLIAEDGLSIQTFKPQNGFEANLKKEETATLLKYF